MLPPISHIGAFSGLSLYVERQFARWRLMRGVVQQVLLETRQLELEAGRLFWVFGGLLDYLDVLVA